MCYNGIMDKTEIEELIEQAEAQKKKWRKPSNEPPPSFKQWQQIMDDRLYRK